MMLYAPKTYWEATIEKLDGTCNGCGAKDGLGVPDSILWLSIKEACQIHDWMYQYGITELDKVFSDSMFIMNITTIIRSNSSKVMSVIRLYLASNYYIAVASLGDKAYWVDKEYNDSSVITFKGEFR